MDSIGTLIPSNATARSLTPVELLALVRAGKPAEKMREFVADGTEREIDLLVRLVGKVQVGMAYESERNVAPDAVTLLALVLENVSDESPVDFLVRLERWANETEGKPSSEFKYMATQAIERMSRPKSIQYRGAVNGKVTAEVIENAESH